MVKLYAVVSSDGYLYGATEDDNGCEEWYWDAETTSDDWDIVLITVPNDMKQALCEHGTSGQVYATGYEAWQDVLKRGSFTEI